MLKTVFNYIKKFVISKKKVNDELDSSTTNETNKVILNKNLILKNFYEDCYQIFKGEIKNTAFPADASSPKTFSSLPKS